VVPLLFTFVIEEFSMSRDQNGRFTDCGNPKGRPKTLKYSPPIVIGPNLERDDFFEVDNSPVTVTEHGKRRQISVRRAIYQNIAYKAASGDIRAAIEWNKMRTRFISQYVDEQMSMLAQIIESEKIARHAPEDVTDKFHEVLKNLKSMLGPGYEYN
jgi:hypothetical protein